MDILSVTKGIITHQFNCQGVMGCGIELQIRQKWPEVYQRYKAFARAAQSSNGWLGNDFNLLLYTAPNMDGKIRR